MFLGLNQSSFPGLCSRGGDVGALHQLQLPEPGSSFPPTQLGVTGAGCPQCDPPGMELEGAGIRDHQPRNTPGNCRGWALHRVLATAEGADLTTTVLAIARVGHFVCWTLQVLVTSAGTGHCRRCWPLLKVLATAGVVHYRWLWPFQELIISGDGIAQVGH